MYSREKNVQYLISGLKKRGIKRIIASPGNTNTSFIASIQNDHFFDIYSCVDERSAAYIAVGMAVESGEIVALSCTGATASRNYLPGLTEAFYRKIPILAITSSQPVSRNGHHSPQFIDRTSIPKDAAIESFELPIVKDDDDAWHCQILLNKALSIVTSKDTGPVHINLPTTFQTPFDIKVLPEFRNIQVFNSIRCVSLRNFKRVAIFVGSSIEIDSELTSLIDDFCRKSNAIVICDHTSRYKGAFRVNYSIFGAQEFADRENYRPDLVIHLGEISGDYHSMSISPKFEVWRVNLDGKIRDTFRKLSTVFQMSLKDFFSLNFIYKEDSSEYFEKVTAKIIELQHSIPDLPLTNIWVAKVLSQKLPKNVTLHFGILNTLRSWNFFSVDDSVKTEANVGGFGIDGSISTLVGASLVDSNRLYFLVLGDLAFFYDINVLGNRHIGGNLRIIVINNGKGTEFAQYNHHAANLGVDVNTFIAADGHNRGLFDSPVKGFVTELGFQYIRIETKNDFERELERFLLDDQTSKIMEIFVNSEDESKALEKVQTITINKSRYIKNKIKKVINKK